ncbi:MAG: glycosyltransferase family 2 protein [Nitrospirae bacterium]|nr:glycosyltransferase family 2 protein [Nitrospirota bacterium]
MSKTLVFIPAYEAELTIGKVLDRLAACAGAKAWDVLVVDDASRDRTVEVVKAYRKPRAFRSLEVRCNARNLGYGGNCKVGLRTAVEQGAEGVAVLHGDGQYPPEEIGRLVDGIVFDRADLVFGSRLSGRPLAGGMPLYKWVGNSSLTWMENRVAGLHLTEWHSGFRAYRVASLKEVPFERNSNRFAFDVQIILQFAASGMRVREFSIPTHYGEDSRAMSGPNALRLGAEVIASLFDFAIARSGWGASPSFPFGPPRGRERR